MSRKVMLELSKIRTDGGTQMRVKLDEATVQHYMELMEDGVAFRPIDVYYDGADHWLTDGFHRREAAERLKKERISTIIKKGTLRDAKWAAGNANAVNGLSFTLADRKNKLDMILAEFPEQSDAVIAKHIKMSKTTVAAHRAQVYQNHTPDVPRVGLDGKTYPAPQPSAKSKVTSEPDPVGEIPMGDLPAPSKTADAPAPAKAAAPPVSAVFEDQIGTDLHTLNCKQVAGIREAFHNRGEILAVMRLITTTKNKILELHRSGNEHYAKLNQSAWQADGENFRRDLYAILPHAVCPYCSGDGCDACHKSGWLSKLIYQQTPEYMMAKRGETIKDDDE